MKRLLILILFCLSYQASGEKFNNTLAQEYPSDELYTSPEQYGIKATDYSKSLPPPTAPFGPKLEGKTEKQIMKEIQEKPIFHYGESVEKNNCDDNCNNNGDCQKLIRDLNPEVTGKHYYMPKYLCVCQENYSGASCSQCAVGFYGETCNACKRNPADLQICGYNGICDDGIHGTGFCFCKDPNHDPD